MLLSVLDRCVFQQSHSTVSASRSSSSANHKPLIIVPWMYINTPSLSGLHSVSSITLSSKVVKARCDSGSLCRLPALALAVGQTLYKKSDTTFFTPFTILAPRGSLGQSSHVCMVVTYSEAPYQAAKFRPFPTTPLRDICCQSSSI